MFSFFKSKREKLMQKHRELLQQAYHWSAIDRRKSDELYAQAAELETQITATI